MNDLITPVEKIHLWYIRLSTFGERLNQFYEFLSSAEQERASRFRFTGDRERFVFARGGLRCLVGRYLGIHPTRIDLFTAEFGKLYVNPAQNPAGLSFNVSHSNDYALLAFSSGFEVGVDIEFIQPMKDMAAVSNKILTLPELSFLADVFGMERVGMFYRFWVVKEACAKASGLGLQINVDQLAVRLPERSDAGFDCVNWVSGNTAWMIQELTLDADYCAAVATPMKRYPVDVLPFSASMADLGCEFNVL